MESAKSRFLRYVSYYTTSDDFTGTSPSTERQKDLGNVLMQELEALHLEDVHMDDCGNVLATLPASEGVDAPVIALIAHMDTAEEVSGANVKARVIENYDGEDIVLNKELGIVTDVENFPILKKFKGKTLIVTDGTTLLGADDKAGVAEIMQAAEDIIKNNLPHGEIHIAFTPDEEIGAGPDKFDVKGFGCDFAYTLDGGELGGLDYENFNGTSADVEITGRSVHPGSAKNKMINASRVAMEFASLLPSREVPENTEGYEGFAHLNNMEGDVEHAHLHYIIRDHDRDLLEARKDKFNLAAEFINRKYGLELVKVTLKDAYSNMKEMILPHQEILDVARAAMRKNGVEPVTTPIRGGTDGARLSFMGLPCPNLCTGGELAHGRNEFAVLEEMETIVEIVKSIAELVE